MEYETINADLHIHGLYSGAVSKDMVPTIIGREAPLKGIHLVGTGDILHPKWFSLIKEQLSPTSDEAIFEHQNKTRFILQTEIEDRNRVHHLILFPSHSKVQELSEKFKKHSKSLETDGRPKVWLSGEEIAELCIESDCLLGFCHAFTPYFGLFAKFDSYKTCYGNYWKKIHFLELGLSADTNMADQISELHNLTFTANSDAHSPWPNKMGREFNAFKLKEITFKEVSKALKREQERTCVLNVGFNPLEGKYHRTRCRGCLTFFNPEDAIKLQWRCPLCKNSIKKGVDFRIQELANTQKGAHPPHRPKYIHTIPLSEIIALAYNIKNAWSSNVLETWKRFITKFKNEINVLIHAENEDLKKIDAKVATHIQYFRENKISYIPGGAGIYGKLLKPGESTEIKTFNKTQKTLDQF